MKELMNYPSYYTAEDIALIESKKSERKEDVQKILHILEGKTNRHAHEVIIELQSCLRDQTIVTLVPGH